MCNTSNDTCITYWALSKPLLYLLYALHIVFTLTCDSRIKLFCTNLERVRTNTAFFHSPPEAFARFGSRGRFWKLFCVWFVWHCNVYTFGLRAYVTFIQNGKYNKNLSHIHSQTSHRTSRLSGCSRIMQIKIKIKIILKFEWANLSVKKS